MINILFYLFPALVFILAGTINYDKGYSLNFFQKRYLHPEQIAKWQ